MSTTTPRALVIRAAGTNCDAEMCRAFVLAGASPDLVHVDALIAEPSRIEQYDLLAFPGGFSYGDDIASGRIFAMKLREKLYPALRAAAVRGCPMIGACNGFQVLVQVGLLPGPSAGAGSGGVAWPEDAAPAQTAALSFNAGGRFIDAWLGVTPTKGSRCIWTAELEERFGGEHAADVMRLPIAHGEGRFVAASKQVLSNLDRNGQVAMRYVDNVNGSEQAIAGICDATGRIFGLMPHPERYLDWTLHPYWTRLPASVRRGPTPGLVMFQSAVRAAVGAGV
ncbi:MAG: phosphoribosylformylglycinamidine synthase subunit PurQ [Phycisphaerales bacterium]|nr:phosphoribosylformylglycinamidine synthase subunit PurQ [Phycisphaerales bacterium]